jgi:hypothetical protein
MCWFLAVIEILLCNIPHLFNNKILLYWNIFFMMGQDNFYLVFIIKSTWILL